MYSLLIVDDEPEIVEFLHGLLSEIEDLELYLYKAFSGEEAVEWLNRVRMDMVVTDMRMPGISGLELLHRIKANWPACWVSCCRSSPTSTCCT